SIASKSSAATTGWINRCRSKGFAIASNVMGGRRATILPRSIQWTFHPSNPVIVPGKLNPSFDDRRTAGAFVVPAGDIYRMYYWATGADRINRVCMAEAPIDRPNEWKGLGVAIEPQRDTDYNYNGPVCPSVL